MKPSNLYDDLKVGDRVSLVVTSDPFAKLPSGTRGTVIHPTTHSQGGVVGVYDHSGDEPVLVKTLDGYRVVSVRWDNGSWLMLIPEAGDSLRPLTDEELAAESDVPDVHRPITADESFPVIATGAVKRGLDVLPTVPATVTRRVATDADKALAMLEALHGGKEGS